VEKQKAQHNIRDLKMKGDDLDGFIAQFATTAKKAGYDLNSEVTLSKKEKSTKVNVKSAKSH